MNTYQAIVARGINFLDQREPGTVDRIDSELVDLADPWSCPLGQTWAGPSTFSDEHGFGPYAAHATALGLTASDAISYGFTAPAGDLEAFGALTREWQRQLLARRAVLEVAV